MKRRNFSHLFFYTLLLGLSVLLLPARPGAAVVPEGQLHDVSGLLEPALYLPIVSSPEDGAGGEPPEIISLSADPATINAGDSSTLSWQVNGATSLSISPGVGVVTGSSIEVSPANTTEYTLTATNAHGSDSDEVTVTVIEPPPAGPDGFFITPLPDIEAPSSHPTARTDSDGGVHVVFTPDSSIEEGVRPAFYAYCPAGCTDPSAFTITQVGEGVDFAALDLTPGGAPRLLLRVPIDNVYVYQYWECNSNCLQPASWSGESIGYSYARTTGWVEAFTRSFSLDHQGRPRFVYYDAGADYSDPHWGVFYAFCDTDCTSPGNWYETRVLEDRNAGEFDLDFTSGGLPQFVYSTYDGANLTNNVAYAECRQNCSNGVNWDNVILLDVVSSSVTSFANFSLEVTTGGRARVALYAGTGIGGTLPPGRLYYLACRLPDCMDLGSWSVVDIGLPDTHGEEGISLALDAQNRPRLAYHAPLAAGFGLYYAWCDAADCQDVATGWQAQELEASEEVNEELPIPPWEGCPTCVPPIPPCTISTWDTGMRPSLALDPAGQPRIAYDADHGQGGACGTFTDTRLTRFIQLQQP